MALSKSGVKFVNIPLQTSVEKSEYLPSRILHFLMAIHSDRKYTYSDIDKVKAQKSGAVPLASVIGYLPGKPIDKLPTPCLFSANSS